MGSLQDFYSVEAAAKEVGLSFMALHMRIYRGTVKVERPGKRIVLVHRDEVERLKRERGEGQ